jgi:hypothetical protein
MICERCQENLPEIDFPILDWFTIINKKIERSVYCKDCIPIIDWEFHRSLCDTDEEAIKLMHDSEIYFFDRDKVLGWKMGLNKYSVAE